MKNNSDKNRNLDWVKEPISTEFKSKVFKAVHLELDKNRTPSFAARFNLNWTWSIVAGLALLSVMVIRLTGQLDLTSPTTTFDDLALLTPAEIELVENLDIIDDLNDIDLEQIRNEMKKQKGPKS